jgi:hypothetical protein
MAAVTTERLLEIALGLAGWDTAPPDCAIYSAGTRISHVLIGLDVGASDIFMARQLGYHAVIAYHPPGAHGPAWEVYRRHIEQLVAAGVPRDDAERAIEDGIERLEFALRRQNADHVASVARMLEMPLITIQSPLGETARRQLQRHLDDMHAVEPDASVAAIRDALLALPYVGGAPVAPGLALGDWQSPAGRVVVSYGAYATLDASIARAYFAHGAGTLVCADFALDDARQLRREGIAGAVLTLGEDATASAGMLPYVERLRQDGLEVTTFSGIIEPDAGG